MKFRFEKKYLYWGITAFLVIAASLVFYYLLFHMNNVRAGFRTFTKTCMPIIDGLVLAYLMTPLVKHMERDFFIPLCKRLNLNTESAKTKKRMRLLSALITVIFVFVLLYLLCASIIPQLIVSIQNIALQLPVYATNLQDWIQKLFENNDDLAGIVTSLINQYSNELEDYLNSKLVPQLNVILTRFSSSIFSSMLGLLVTAWNLLIGLIISVYLLVSKESFAGQSKKIIYAIWEEETANKLISNIRFVNATFGGFINGKLVDSLIIGLICFIGMTLLQLPYPLLISVIVGITNIIPFFGPYLGAIPSIVLILMVNPKQALYFAIFVLILQQFDGNFLGPKILGNKTGLSSFWVIFSITLFGGYWGILGMAIGVPVFAVIYAGIKALVNQQLVKRGFSTNTKDYMFLSEIKDNHFVELPPPKQKERKGRKKGTESKEPEKTEIK
ncbi:MAG: AI-2E family transporter [Lachnospiraceae bacterium]|nr:AI-2E family transporter [Lachnospiraceae bacterium]